MGWNKPSLFIIILASCSGVALYIGCSSNFSKDKPDSGADADVDSDGDNDADSDADTDSDADSDVDGDGGVSEDPNMGPGTENPYDTEKNSSDGVKTNDDGWLILESELKRDRNNLWVSNSGEHTVSNVDTEALKEVGRYYTGLGDGSDPSRTSVDLAGDVFVGNRGDGSVTKISGSTDRCIDRNKNGKIDTSELDPTTGAYKPLPRAGKADPHGVPEGQSTDECVLWTKDLKINLPQGQVPCSGTRGVAATSETGTNFEYNGHVWIGCSDSQNIFKLNGNTGDIMKDYGPFKGMEEDGISIDVTPYGFVLDKAEKNRLWISGKRGGNQIVYWMDTETGAMHPAVDKDKFSPNPYGIALDDHSHVWITVNGKGEVWRYKPDAKLWESIIFGDKDVKFKGIAVDVQGTVWPVINKPGSGVYMIMPAPDPNEPLTKATVQGPFSFDDKDGPNTPDTGTGVAVDFSGHVWGVSESGCKVPIPQTNTGCASRLVIDRSGATPVVSTDPNNVPVGLKTYSYSDMIGYSLLNFTTKEGWYRQRFAVCKDKSTKWKQISFESKTPATTNFVIRARTADQVADLKNAEWFIVVTVPSDVSPVDLPVDLPQGHFIELEVRLYTKTNGVTPAVGAIQFSYECTYETHVE